MQRIQSPKNFIDNQHVNLNNFGVKNEVILANFSFGIEIANSSRFASFHYRNATRASADT